MRKTISYFMLLWAAVFTFAACNPKDETEVATLTLGKKALTFANSGGDETVSVETNQDSWVAFVSNGDWINLTKSGSKLKVVAKANDKGEVRTATVVVLAGGAQDLIEVTQSKADITISLDFSETELFMPTKGGQKFVEVKANSDEWSLEELDADVTWLNVVKTSSLIVIEAQENTTFETREVSLFAKTATGETKEISISQAGKSKYLLPNMDLKFDLRNVIYFEAARGSIVKSLSDPYENPYFGSAPGQYIFYTASDRMPLIGYVLETAQDTRYAGAVTLLLFENPDKTTELTEYEAFLKENGFVKDATSSESLRRFSNSEKMMNVSIEVTEKVGADVVFTFEVKQPQEYKTFSKFPYGADGTAFNFIGDFTKKVTDVDDYEAGLGSTQRLDWGAMGKVVTTEVLLRMFTTNKTGDEEAQRGYFFYTTESNSTTPAERLQSVVELDLYFTDITLALWKDGGKYKLTKEFEALATKEGFAFRGTSQGYFVFSKEASEGRTLMLFVGFAKYKNVLDGADCLNVAYFYRYPAANGAIVNDNLRYAREGKLDKISFINKNLDEGFLKRRMSMLKK